MRDFRIDLIWTKIQIAVAALGGWLGYFLGGMDGLLIALIILMALDYISGTLAAKRKGEWSSKIAREGLYHKSGSIIAVGAAAIVDFVFYFLIPTLPIMGRDIRNPGVFLPLVLAWYIITEIGSVLENVAGMGAAVPKWFLKAIEATKKNVDKAGEAHVPEDGEDQ